MKYQLIFILALFADASCGAAEIAMPFTEQSIAKQGISAEQATAILEMVLKHDRIAATTTLNKERLLDKLGNDIRPGYYSFGVTADSAANGATTVYGMFAVSRLTGDVWEWNYCRRYRFAALTQLQTRIMKRTGKRFRDEQAARRQLGCTD